jgi:hypothetical protein
MSAQVIPSAVALRIIVKFLTNESVKPADILVRLRAQFGDETLSKTQVYVCLLFKRGRTGVEYVRRLRHLQGRLRTALSGSLRSFFSSVRSFLKAE